MSLKIDTNVSLDTYTTFKTGGPATYFVTAKTVHDVQDAVAYVQRHSMPLYVLGGGSNVLIDDSGLDGLVLRMCISGIEYSDEGEAVRVYVGAGVEWDGLVKDAVSRGLWGLENLSAIPGTVGASVVQNIGAYGAEVASCVLSVSVYDRQTDTVKELPSTACGFGYRMSIFKGAEQGRYIILGVTFRLMKDAEPCISYKDLHAYFGEKVPTLADVRNAVCTIRARKFPDLRTHGTGGSFFMNPVISYASYEALLKKYPELPGYKTDVGVKVSAAWILDKIIDAKGRRSGNVGCHTAQPLVVVNYGGASTGDILAFTDELAQRVHAETGIQLEREVRFIHS